MDSSEKKKKGTFKDPSSYLKDYTRAESPSPDLCESYATIIVEGEVGHNFLLLFPIP